MTSMYQFEPEIVVFEDQASFVEALGRFLTNVGDARTPRSLFHLVQNDEAKTWRRELSQATMALVDLELGASLGKGPKDTDGLDVVLPRLRVLAPWLPAVLMSVHFVDDHLSLLRAAEGDFDAVLPKDVFDGCSARDWSRFSDAVAVNRVAASTSRSVKEVRTCRERVVEVEMGRTVQAQLRDLGSEEILTAIRMLGLGGDRLVLEPVSPGFSGLAVVKALVSDGERDARWLLKLGSNVHKLVDECTAHWAMVTDGSARRLSAPMLYRAPVVCQGRGVIAYEFEEDAVSLRELARNAGIEAAVESIVPMLSRFAHPLRDMQVIPTEVLDFRALVRLAKVGKLGTHGRFLATLLEEPSGNPLVESSASCKTGRQHGDLHSLNILVGEGGPLMIDFAHYRSRRARGMPLLDIVKLAVDLWVFGIGQGRSRPKFDAGFVLEREFAGVVSKVSLATSSDDTIRLTCLSLAAEGGRYLEYSDVPAECKRDLISAIEAVLLELVPPGTV